MGGYSKGGRERNAEPPIPTSVDRIQSGIGPQKWHRSRTSNRNMSRWFGRYCFWTLIYCHNDKVYSYTYLHVI